MGVDLIPLRAGPLSMTFDPSNAFLRSLRVGDREVVRGIFGAVRNRNWETVAPDVQHVSVNDRDGGFLVTFEAICCDGDVEFTWRGEIAGAADGTITYLFDGEAHAAFMKNRIGICVLHPIRECAGQPCRVVHVDGTVTDGAFPRLIAPHQPFKAMRSISHEVVPGLRATVTLEGDVFEMEDQRNWTDGSFKTYSTPLHLPFPVRLEAGARVRQTVRLQLEGIRRGRLEGAVRPARAVLASRRPRIRIAWPVVSRMRPPIGFGMGAALNDSARAALAALAPDHIRVDLQLTAPAWRERLHEAARVAQAAGATVHAALFVSDTAEQELEAVRAEAEVHRLPVGLWLVFHVAEKSTRARWIELASRILGDSIPLAAGTNAYFAELNRSRPPANTPALPCFSINPQVHASDDRSLVETLEAQRGTVETARSFCPKPVVISPITLRPRFNPNATEMVPDHTPERDPRQLTGFGAAWTLGTLARLASSPDVHSLTFYETAGPRGVMDEQGRLFPMGHVFAAVAGWPRVSDAESDAPLCVDALALEDAGGCRRVLVAGLDTRPVRVLLERVQGTAACRVLGEGGFGAAHALDTVDGRLELDVPPAGVVLLDLAPGDEDLAARVERPA